MRFLAFLLLLALTIHQPTLVFGQYKNDLQEYNLKGKVNTAACISWNVDDSSGIMIKHGLSGYWNYGIENRIVHFNRDGNIITASPCKELLDTIYHTHYPICQISLQYDTSGDVSHLIWNCTDSTRNQDISYLYEKRGDTKITYIVKRDSSFKTGESTRSGNIERAVLSYDHKGKPLITIIIEYNEMGNPVKIEEVVGNLQKTTTKIKWRNDQKIREKKFTYQKEPWKLVSKTYSKYDSYGNCVMRKGTLRDKWCNLYENTVDEKGNIIKQKIYIKTLFKKELAIYSEACFTYYE